MKPHDAQPADAALDSASDAVQPNEATRVSSRRIELAAGSVVRADDPTRVSGEPRSGSHAGAGSTGGSTTGVGPVLQPDDAHIPGYRLEEELHRGGQGIVYRALQLSTKRRVALKVLLEGPFAGDTARRRFEREVELAASFQHPNIVTILDSGTSFGRYYFAMELVDGLRLDRYLAQVRPDLEETLTIFAKICDAVNYAHQRGVIHRDLKPSNILIDPGGEPRVLDFGLAKATRDHAAAQDVDEAATRALLSTTGQIVGTVAYMSPEQARGEGDIDVRSDVYSLGVLFYEGLLGQAPYTVTGPLGEVLNSITTAEPLRPRLLRSKSRHGAELNDELETILLKSLEKERARRYQTAGDLGRDLRHLLAGEPVEAKRASNWYVLRKLLRRYRIPVAAAGVGFIALIGFLIAFAVLYRQARDARDKAQELREIALQQTADARQAEIRERESRREAVDAADAALRAQADLRRALARQRIERGNLASERGGLTEARDSYWEADADQAGPGSLWALRQYYLTTGDNGARVLFHERAGPLAVDVRGKRALIQESPNAISERALDSGVLRRWLPIPDAAQALSDGPDGVIAAAGDDWVRVWEKEAVAPRYTFALPRDAASPRAVFFTAAPPRITLFRDRTFEFWDAATGRRIGRAALDGELQGEIAAATDGSVLLVPTTNGVTRFTVRDGQIRAEEIWEAGRQGVDAVTLLPDGRPALLAGTLYLGTAESPPQWRSVRSFTGQWDRFDYLADSDWIALGRRSGEVALFDRGSEVATWRTTLGALEALWIDPAAQAVVTLDASGSVTDWIPLTRKEPRRVVRNRPMSHYVVSAGGETAVMRDRLDRLFLYTPSRSRQLLSVGTRQPFRLFLTRGVEAPFAVSGNGDRVAAQTEGELTLIESLEADADQPPRKYVLPSPAVDASLLALNGDGSVLATVTSRNGVEQVVALWDWPSLAAQRSVPTSLQPHRPPYVFVGSAIRELHFVPESDALLVARSNGELTLLSASPVGPAPANADIAGAAPPRPWLVLDSPATTLALNRTGSRLAVACEDGALRTLNLETGDILTRTRIDEAPTSLGYSHDAATLLLRKRDGRVWIIDADTGVLISEIPVEPGPSPALAFWLGEDDRVVLNELGRTVEFSFRDVDALIEQNRAYSLQRAIDRHLEVEEFESAWATTALLVRHSPALARSERVRLLENLFRRPGLTPPADWLDELRDDLPLAEALRLAHAAYDGLQFNVAFDYFEQAARADAPPFDARSMRRWAECYYLREDYADAAARLGEVAQRTDLPPDALPTVQLVQAAALILGGEPAEARRVITGIGNRDPRTAASLAARSAASIGSVLIGTQSETFITAAFAQLFETFAEESLNYTDDPHFFRAELARARGDTAEAAAEYQLCLDLARDVWPANWARYRLIQMSQQFGAP